MAPRLKVFATSDGLTDFVVATTSKPKALAAWGAHQDLFATGIAREVDDPELVQAALAQPGVVLRRTADPEAILKRLAAQPKPKIPAKPAAVRREPDRPPPRAAPPPPRGKPKLALVLPPPPKPAGRSKAALKKVADLEAKIAALDADLRQALDELDRRREILRNQHAKARAKLKAALAAARRALT